MMTTILPHSLADYKRQLSDSSHFDLMYLTQQCAPLAYQQTKIYFYPILYMAKCKRYRHHFLTFPYYLYRRNNPGRKKTLGLKERKYSTV